MRVHRFRARNPDVAREEPVPHELRATHLLGNPVSPLLAKAALSASRTSRATAANGRFGFRPNSLLRMTAFGKLSRTAASCMMQRLRQSDGSCCTCISPVSPHSRPAVRLRRMTGSGRWYFTRHERPLSGSCAAPRRGACNGNFARASDRAASA